MSLQHEESARLKRRISLALKLMPLLVACVGVGVVILMEFLG